MYIYICVYIIYIYIIYIYICIYYIYIYIYILGAWAHIIKKDILFAYTPPKKDAFLSIFNENIFFSKFSGLDGCNTPTRKRYKIIPGMSLLLIKI